MKHTYHTYFLRALKVDYAIKENPKDVCDANRPYRITQAGMMSKFRKLHLREPELAKFPGGACPRTPLEVRAFGANKYHLYSFTWGWNLCGNKLQSKRCPVGGVPRFHISNLDRSDFLYSHTLQWCLCRDNVR